MRRSIARVLSVLVTLALIVLFSRYVTDIWYLYIVYSVGVQIGLVLTAASLLILALKRSVFGWALVALSVFVTLHSWILLGEFGHAAPPNAPIRLKLLTFNILGSNSLNGKGIADKIMASGADVVFLQESAPIGPHIDAIKTVYPYRTGCGVLTITCDLSLWSKRPFINAEVKTVSPLFRDRFMIASINIDGEVIHFATAHLSKPYFDEAHAVELKRIAKIINATQGPFVLGGDFNAAVLALDLRKFLHSTGMNTFTREPNTWPVGAIRAGVAIDHIFVRQPLAITSLERLPDNLGSNHFGLMAEFTLSR